MVTVYAITPVKVPARNFIVIKVESSFVEVEVQVIKRAPAAMSWIIFRPSNHQSMWSHVCRSD